MSKYTIRATKVSKNGKKEIVGYVNGKGKIDYKQVEFDTMTEARDVFRLAVACNPKFMASSKSVSLALMENGKVNTAICFNINK